MERQSEFKRVDAEVKILRRQKRSSFRLFCESLDPSQSINKIWVTLRALSSRSGALRTNILTGMNSSEFKALRDDLVREDVSPADILLRGSGVGNESLDELFTRKELDSPMAAYRAKSAPGLDSVSYDVLKRFSCRTRSLVLSLFDLMFWASIFPTSWRDTYVIFIPKLGGKGYQSR